MVYLFFETLAARAAEDLSSLVTLGFISSLGRATSLFPFSDKDGGGSREKNESTSRRAKRRTKDKRESDVLSFLGRFRAYHRGRYTSRAKAGNPALRSSIPLALVFPLSSVRHLEDGGLLRALWRGKLRTRRWCPLSLREDRPAEFSRKGKWPSSVVGALRPRTEPKKNT